MLLDPLGTRSSRPSDLTGSVGSPLGSSAALALSAPAHLARPTMLATPKPSSVAAAAPASSPAPAPAAAPQSFAFNPDEDPIVQMVKAAGQRSVQQAQASELAGRKQTLIDYGYDPALNSLYPDQSTADAAQQNPFSFLANLGHNYAVAGHNLDEGLNKQNLFYSSERGTQLGELARSEGQQQATGYGSLQHALGALSDAVLKTSSDAAGANLNAAGDAYNRYTPPETTAAAPAAVAAAAPPTEPAQLDDQILADLARIRRR